MPAFIDYSNRKIGRVTVISLESISSGGTRWNCQCDCGTKFICWSKSFKRGDLFECKPCWYERRRGIDLTGRKFGRWTVLHRHINEHNKTCWYCRCDCGKEGLVATSALGKEKKSMSCGCLGRKRKSKHINTTLYPPSHGLSRSKFYTIKTSLIHKCYNDKHPSYKNFGLLGITVCDLWRNGAKDMYEWAIENGWEEGDVIILKSEKKEFNPDNCEIIKNSSFRSIIGLKGGFHVTYRGETHSVLHWAKLLNVDPCSLRNKLSKCPCPDIVFNSEFKKMKFIRDPLLIDKAIDLYIAGKTRKQIGDILGVSYGTITYNLEKNQIELRNDTRKHKRPDIDTKEILSMHEKGIPLNRIANELGCSFPTVKNRIMKHKGIKRDRSKG